jgi:hypothetical protein
MSDDDLRIECGAHGEGPVTYICRHLSKGEKLGFNAGHDPDVPDALYPDAWCDACNAMLSREGEWNERSESFAGIKAVCSGCYQDIRARNWRQNEDALHTLIGGSVDYLHQAQENFIETYRAGEHDRWDWNQETGKLIFSHAGRPVVECDIDFVGSFSNHSDSWMWAWANNSLSEGIKAESRKMRALGEEQKFLPLASAIWPADPVDGWEMTAVMAKELGAIGAYRTPGDDGFVHMIVRDARWL